MTDDFVFSNGEPVGAGRHEEHEEKIERLEKENDQLRQKVASWRKKSTIMSVVSFVLGVAISLIPTLLL